MKVLTISVLIFLLATVDAIAQSAEQLVQEKLIETGFENIRVDADQSEFTISFENNIYRWDVRALSTALDTISKYTPENASINIIQLRYNLPQIITKVNTTEWLTFRNDSTISDSINSALSVSYQTNSDWDKIKKLKPENSSTTKFDFVFYPQFFLVNLTFDKIYEIQFNIAPALEVSFWKGSQFTAQVILPIYSDSEIYGTEGNKIRPGFIAFTQNFRLPGPWFGNVSVGNFNVHRYGIDFNIMHPFKNPKWEIGLNAGLTGSSAITDNGWEFGKLNTFTFYVNAGYFLSRFNLRFEAKAGRFLYGDYGGRFDLTRMFGETSIGFYAAYTIDETDGDGHPNAGFYFSIPFPPGKRLKHKRFRINTPRYFDWEYNGATDLLYNRYFETQPNQNGSENYFNPVYIKNELLKNRHYK